MKLVPARAAQATEISGDTPALRLIALLEAIAAKDRMFSLQALVEETGVPKPTLHRMLQQLEAGGLLHREGDGRHYGTGVRLRRLAENVLINDSRHGARRAVLRHLVEEVGESCNITALSGSEVIYLDRVETAAPLRFYLQAGSRVPVHCSASGKIFLAQMSLEQRRRLLAHAPLEAYTANTRTSLARLERELQQVQRDGYALDDEEFLPGLLCIAVQVPAAADPVARATKAAARAAPKIAAKVVARPALSNLCVAIQAPVMRMSAAKARQWLPALQRAASALGRIDADAPPLAGKTRAG